MAVITQVAGWLASLGLEGYTTLFAQHRIGFDVLPALTDQDLEKLGVPLGDRKRLLKAAAALSQAAPPAYVDAGAGVERRQALLTELERLQCDAHVAGLNLAREAIDAAIAAMQSSGAVAH